MTKSEAERAAGAPEAPELSDADLERVHAGKSRNGSVAAGGVGGLLRGLTGGGSSAPKSSGGCST